MKKFLQATLLKLVSWQFREQF